MVDATRTNRMWLLKQNEHDLLVRIQKGIQGDWIGCPCILEVLDDWKISRQCVLDANGKRDCSTCISKWLNEEHK